MTQLALKTKDRLNRVKQLHRNHLMLPRNAARRILAIFLCIGTFGLLVLFAPHSRPSTVHAPDPAPNAVSTGKFQGRASWAILLCKFADQPHETQPVEFFRDMFTEDGVGSRNVFDYWNEVSYGNITTEGSKVFGWFTIAHTVEEAEKLDRLRRFLAGVEAAKNAGVDLAGYFAVLVVVNANVDCGTVSWSGPQKTRAESLRHVNRTPCRSRNGNVTALTCYPNPGN